MCQKSAFFYTAFQLEASSTNVVTKWWLEIKCLMAMFGLPLFGTALAKTFLCAHLTKIIPWSVQAANWTDEHCYWCAKYGLSSLCAGQCGKTCMLLHCGCAVAENVWKAKVHVWVRRWIFKPLELLSDASFFLRLWRSRLGTRCLCV